MSVFSLISYTPHRQLYVVVLNNTVGADFDSFCHYTMYVSFVKFEVLLPLFTHACPTGHLMMKKFIDAVCRSTKFDNVI